ncbi:MAG TPA: glycosyltransferase family 4 protein [Candidatus Eisenbacteria bacterium]
MRVLFIDEGHGVGGSTISLYYLMRELAGRGVEPVVWFSAPHAWSERFRALGVEVIYGRTPAAAPEPALVAQGAPGIAIPAMTGGRSAAPATASGGYRDSDWYRRLSFYKSHWQGHRRGVSDWRGRIEALRPQVVYANNALPLNFAVLTAASELGLGVVCALRGLQPLRAPHRAFKGKLHAGVAISELVRRHYLAAGFEESRIVRVYNGVDLQDYPWQAPSPQVAKTGGRILFLGRLTGWKGAEVLLKAVAHLVPRRPKLVTVVAGDGPARGDWERMAADLGIARRIRFVGFQPDVMTLLRDSDLLVHASTAPEPFGRVLVEGMAAGVPVVASDHGAAPEIIESGTSGWLARPGNVEALAAAIDEGLSAGARRVTVARAARERVEANFTVNRTADAVHQLLAGLEIPR